MQGLHSFDLDCMYLTKSARAFEISIVVEYEVEIGWNEGDQSVTHESTKPVKVTTEIGGNEMHSELFTDLFGSLKDFILVQSKTLSLEQLGITDEEAREELADIEEHRAFENDHRAGAV